MEKGCLFFSSAYTALLREQKKERDPGSRERSNGENSYVHSNSKLKKASEFQHITNSLPCWKDHTNPWRAEAN